MCSSRMCVEDHAASHFAVRLVDDDADDALHELRATDLDAAKIEAREMAVEYRSRAYKLRLVEILERHVSLDVLTINTEGAARASERQRSRAGSDQHREAERKELARLLALHPDMATPRVRT